MYHLKYPQYSNSNKDCVMVAIIEIKKKNIKEIINFHLPLEHVDFDRFPVPHFHTMIQPRSAKPKTLTRNKVKEMN